MHLNSTGSGEKSVEVFSPEPINQPKMGLYFGTRVFMMIQPVM